MTTFVINRESPESKSFTFRGDCCIHAEGSGSFKLLREMNNKYVAVTNQSGEPLEFASVGGTAFNSHFSCNVTCKYKIRATGDMIVTIKTEK